MPVIHENHIIHRLIHSLREVTIGCLKNWLTFIARNVVYEIQL